MLTRCKNDNIFNFLVTNSRIISLEVLRCKKAIGSAAAEKLRHIAAHHLEIFFREIIRTVVAGAVIEVGGLVS